ncbi:MAG TPA: Rieske 2Fe-2S domain-containing protein [Stellaceae bacterium]|nr:Rieske 2Fe-2S domain-containing protein [Stellaceae bacterium]
MATTSDYAQLTKVGPGTPMGKLLRHYWIPACASDEIVADGPPLRLMLLGEKLIAFRDSQGRVGIFDHRCPHRGASLFLGRNEECGLRCVYHGWKFDVDGNCLDMPNVKPRHSFAGKIKAMAYKALERNGLIWVYMGEAEAAPPFPGLEPLLLPQAQLNMRWAQRHCNWLQAIEGDIDTSHFGFLHEGKAAAENYPADSVLRYRLDDRSPDYHCVETDWGTMYAAYRPATPGQLYYRVAHYLFPFWTMIPNAAFGTNLTARAWVPMDDTHTMFLQCSWDTTLDNLAKSDRVPGLGLNFNYQPKSTDWHGRWRIVPDESNDWMIDRERQRDSTFTGIDGVHLQDQAVTESMGECVDHMIEHLTIGDLMITRTRQRMLNAMRDLAERDVKPPGVENGDIFLGAHGGDFVAPENVDWLETYNNQLRASANPTGALRVPPLAAE